MRPEAEDGASGLEMSDGVTCTRRMQDGPARPLHTRALALAAWMSVLAPADAWHYRVRFEATTLALLPGAGGGAAVGLGVDDAD